MLAAVAFYHAARESVLPGRRSAVRRGRRAAAIATIVDEGTWVSPAMKKRCRSLVGDGETKAHKPRKP